VVQAAKDIEDNHVEPQRALVTALEGIASRQTSNLALSNSSSFIEHIHRSLCRVHGFPHHSGTEAKKFISLRTICDTTNFGTIFMGSADKTAEKIIDRDKP